MQAINMNLYGNYRNRKFTDIFSPMNYTVQELNEMLDRKIITQAEVNSAEIFLYDYHNNGIPVSISDDSATTLYYLLYAYYGNSTVASSDENQFVTKMFSIIFMYGPTWEKRLEIQKSIRNLSIDEIQKGGKAIYNTALNPNTQVYSKKSDANEGTNTLEELKYINQQNTTNYTKSLPEAYSILTEMLETDVTKEFLDKFKKLFLTVVSPELPLWYKTNMEVDDDE